jgi:dienelactone hydrolase
VSKGTDPAVPDADAPWTGSDANGDGPPPIDGGAGRDGAIEPAASAIYVDKSKLLVYETKVGGLTPVVDAETWAYRRAHVVRNMELVMGPLPDERKRVPLDVKVVETVTLPRVIRMKITFAAEPGDRVPAYVLIPRTRDGKAPAMLAIHYTTVDRKSGKKAVAGVDTGGSAVGVPYALEMAERGYVTIAPDYPNFGEYVVDAYKLGYASAAMKAIWNHMRAVDVLQAMPEVDSARVGVIGHSLGGHAAIWSGVFDTRIKAIVSSSGFTTLAKYKPDWYKGPKPLAAWCNPSYYTPRICDVYGADAAQVPFDFTELVGALAPRAFMANAPTLDGNFDYTGVMDCFGAASPVYRLLGAEGKIEALYPAAAHSFLPEARQAAYVFLDRALSAARL